MTQKGDLFKGQKKKKTIPPNRHGKTPHARKGKRVLNPSNVTDDMKANRNKITLSYIVGDRQDLSVCRHADYRGTSPCRKLKVMSESRRGGVEPDRW
ncbi:uncharacterized protein LOC110033006 isoform X1 [Phalaenopsis equestris]|uniref:uncharacterized protein LOC110033006 isoform X1 n=1 Tax=Phalaenopsis equestris TaxID=78828 RepID=UPI0009E60405|nr:uncharacterized protein LOC110033006 isoform X1 [Phalaenopsis equestris]